MTARACANLSETMNTPAPEQVDAAAYSRVQAANQAQIIGKLLHDLRNPLHSLRITVELFSRLASPQADASALLPRAGRYAPGAEAAIEALSRQTERLAVYLQRPRLPALQPMPLNACLHEVAALLRDAAQPHDLEIRSALGDDVSVLADRPRFSHSLLAWMRLGAPRTLTAAEDQDGVYLTAGPASTPQDPDVRALLESAGGRLVDARVLLKRS
jgi:signal transduction histidine kinase